MARSDARRPLLPSLLDRLIDDDPATQAERVSDGYQSLVELRTAIRRDLEDLLNTRTRLLEWPEGGLVERSVLAYGIPDISGRPLGSSAHRQAFLRSVEELIRRFEPRFKSVKVLAQTGRNPFDRTMHFSIQAEVYAEPAPEPLAFDTTVEPMTRSLKVELSDAR